MSTVPGDAWRDAGLETPDDTANPDDTTSLIEETQGSGDDAPPAPEEYRPRHARPDLAGEAAEADVVEQAQEVPEGPEGDAD